MMNKQEAVRLDGDFRDLDKAIAYLIMSRNCGINVVIDFNGHDLYSADVTEDSAYIEVTGFTKKEMDDMIRHPNDKAYAAPYRKALGGQSLDQVIELLKEMEALGYNVYYEFSGHKLFSVGITEEAAYQEVMGCTKEEHLKRVEEHRARADKKTQEAMDKCPYWKAEGYKYIPKELWTEWEENVDNRVFFGGMDLDVIVHVLRMLHDGDIFKTKQQVGEYLKKEVDDRYRGVQGTLEKYSPEYKKLPNENENE